MNCAHSLRLRAPFFCSAFFLFVPLEVRTAKDNILTSLSFASLSKLSTSPIRSNTKAYEFYFLSELHFLFHRQFFEFSATSRQYPLSHQIEVIYSKIHALPFYANILLLYEEWKSKSTASKKQTLYTK